MHYVIRPLLQLKLLRTGKRGCWRLRSCALRVLGAHEPITRFAMEITG